MAKADVSDSQGPDKPGPTLVWFRQDLRLDDHPALVHAIDRGQPVVPVFIWAPDEEKPWQPGAAFNWWTHHALMDLAKSLEERGSKLIVRQGKTQDVLRNLIQETDATAVYWNRRYEPAITKRDEAIKTWLKNKHLEAKSFNGHLMFEPWEIETQAGDPYKVFTPFWRSCQNRSEPDKPLRKPHKLNPLDSKKWPDSLQVEDLGLLPTLPWADGFLKHWDPTEKGARDRFRSFIQDGLEDYKEGRDFPAKGNVSGMSPYLAHGQISPRTLWHWLKDAEQNGDIGNSASAKKSLTHFRNELGWREFAYHVLYHFPHTTNEPLQDKYQGFPWVTDDQALHRWQTGRTGYPLVDAGMRELWGKGWMHNRVRMVVASFLVKDLLIHWLEGARWFWDCLVDADLASNTLGWQWAGGCGADAAPYFRVFNPITQSKKFDADAAYIHAWVPELADIDKQDVHAPWEAKPLALAQHGLRLDDQAADVGYAHEAMEGVYPEPMVDHAEARHKALDALDSIKK